ncbi:hypothetical protein EEB14_39360, partial [Rhodococcus sp. WS4]
TLSALRAAGYAPVVREVDGSVLISAPPHTGPADVDGPDLDLDVIGVPAADPDRHARHLTATAAAAPSEPAGQFPSFAALRGRGQPEAIWELVAGQPAHLTHDGYTHLVHSARLHGNTLTAWSTTTQRYEDFPVAHIAISGHPGAGR